MFKPIISMTVAAAIAGLFAFGTAAVPQASASVDTPPPASVKGDRLPLHVRGAACSQHGWPDFDHLGTRLVPERVGQRSPHLRAVDLHELGSADPAGENFHEHLPVL